MLLDIKDVGDDSLEGLEDVRVMDIRTWDDMEMAYWWLRKNPGRYDAVGLDTLTQLQILCMRKVLEDKSKDPDRAGDWGVMTKKEWGAVSELMKTWIINWRDLPMQVAFIAQDRTFNVGEEDEAQGLDPEVGPALSPSIAKHLNAAVHIVANTFIRSRNVRVKLKNPEKGQSPYREERRVEFCLRVGPNPTYITKVRKAKAIELPPVVVDPTYDKLINILTTRKTDGE